ncbi:alpha-tectorin-like [Chaetodon trifascialis]|uniref:alpha-tectorin-like n=1 Tax=Chaetodon trifascialis TaxID=109706 RepID=UPI003996832A
MLHPLLFLSALIGLAGAEQFNGSSVVNISDCPITFYGKQYEELYVSYENETLVVCFDDYYNVFQPAQDCILGPPVDTESANISISQTISNENLGLVTTMLNDFECDIQMSEYSDVNEFETLVNGSTVDTFNFTSGNGTAIRAGGDISGCRHSGVVHKPGTNASEPEICYSQICNDTAVLIITECGPLDYCQDNSICILNPICTVSGPAVIGFQNHLISVEDRCAYTLLSGSSVSGLTVVGYFRERRRRDMSFLDSVTLQLDRDDDVHLEQGGIVKLGNTTQTINGSTVLSNGVDVSEDQTGVTAVKTIGSYTISVFFDGNTAQILFTGPPGEDPTLGGLCANPSTTLNNERLPGDSNCEVLYNDTADSSINCTEMTEHCNLLNDTSFTTCHIRNDPAPYIDACVDTLCKYPAVDGLDCQFLDAYARDCSLHINDTVDSWRSTAVCSPPQPLCQGRICSDHEFCAETIGGEVGCFCRAIFAFPYKSNDTMGDPTVCEENSASLTLIGCLLEERGINYTTLHLNDQNCTGQMDEEDHMVTFSFNSNDTCGTEVMSNNSLLIYMNTITALNSSSDNITRQDRVDIDFSCFYTQPDVKNMTFRIKESPVIEQFTSGTWNYTLTMKAYTDARHTEAVDSNTEVQLNQKIWVVLETDGLDDGLVAVVTDSCWVTNQAGSLRYNLIKDGCAKSDDETVNVVGNGVGLSNFFSFNMFKFTRSSGDVDLHCKLHLCATLNQTCTPVVSTVTGTTNGLSTFTVIPDCCSVLIQSPGEFILRS